MSYSVLTPHQHFVLADKINVFASTYWNPITSHEFANSLADRINNSRFFTILALAARELGFASGLEYCLRELVSEHSFKPELGKFWHHALPIDEFNKLSALIGSVIQPIFEAGTPSRTHNYPHPFPLQALHSHHVRGYGVTDTVAPVETPRLSNYRPRTDSVMVVLADRSLSRLEVAFTKVFETAPVNFASYEGWPGQTTLVTALLTLLRNKPMSCDLREDGTPDTDDASDILALIEGVLSSELSAVSHNWSMWPSISAGLSLELCKAVAGVVVIQIEEQRRSKEPVTAEDVRVVANALLEQLLKPALRNRRSSAAVEEAIAALTYEQAREIATALTKRF